MSDKIIIDMSTGKMEMNGQNYHVGECEIDTSSNDYRGDIYLIFIKLKVKQEDRNEYQ